jgi:hypothetical protein
MSDDIIARIVIKALDQPDPFGPQGALRLFSSPSKRARACLHDGQITDEERRGAHIRWMETLFWPQDAVNFAVTNRSSVEHVLPRSATGQWIADFPAAMLIHTELFGNLCLVPRNLNKDLGNGQYAQKRPGYLALPPQYKSAHDVASAEQWTMHAIQDRTNRLAKMAVAALRLREPPAA